MASSSSFITGRARSGSLEEERTANFDYNNKGIINIENIKPLPGNDPYKSPSGAYRVANQNATDGGDFRGTLGGGGQEDYRLNSGTDYRGATTPGTDFNRGALGGVDYRNDLRGAPTSSQSYGDYRGAYRGENMGTGGAGEGGGYNKEFRNSTEDLSRGGATNGANSGEYSPGGTRMSTGAGGGAGGANSQYPAHFWNYINGIPSRR